MLIMGGITPDIGSDALHVVKGFLVDDEAVDVVRRIFAMTLEGYGPY